jgi:hypothetical protein
MSITYKEQELKISKRDEQIVACLTKMRFFCTQNDLSPLNLAALIIKAMRIVDEIQKCSGIEKRKKRDRVLKCHHDATGIRL